jgi:hypothetical protein
MKDRDRAKNLLDLIEAKDKRIAELDCRLLMPGRVDWKCSGESPLQKAR